MIKSARKDAKNIFNIIRVSWTSRISFKNMVLIIIGVAYSTEVFRTEDIIKIAYQLAYK